MEVRYAHYEGAWPAFDETVQSLASKPGVRRVCDVGGGASPALPLSFVHEHDLDYVVVDISVEELAKAPSGYRMVHADIAAPTVELEGGFDLILSKFVAEHVAHPERFHRNIRSLLGEGGFAVHLFPTLYASPFVVNRLLPERLTESFLLRVQPHRVPEGEDAKFPARYGWCRGPTKSQLRRLEQAGYAVEEYLGFFGHRYYERVPLLGRTQRALSQRLLVSPNPWLTSFALVTLRARA